MARFIFAMSSSRSHFIASTQCVRVCVSAARVGIWFPMNLNASDSAAAGASTGGGDAVADAVVEM